MTPRQAKTAAPRVPGSAHTVPREERSHGSFKSDVIRAAHGVQSSLTTLFVALPRPIRGGADLQRELGLPSTLSWQLHGAASAPDPIAAAMQIPGRHATKRMLMAAAGKRVPKAILSKAAEAFETFEQVVERHAGDRAAFGSMLSGIAVELSSSTDMEARREAFRATSHLYGVQRTAAINCYIIRPGASGDRYDHVSVITSVGLRVMRPFEKLCVGRHGHIPNHPGALPSPTPFRPVADPGGDLAGVPLLSEFCSKPIPRFTCEPTGTLYVEIYLSGQAVGKTGELSFSFGEYLPGLIPKDEELKLGMTNIFPSEVQVHDVLLAPEIAKRVRAPRTAVYGGPYHDLRLRARDVDRLHTPAHSAFAGLGVESLHTASAPRYVEMLRFVFEKLGWDPDAFSAYRCRIEFPVLHSLLDVVFDGADAPAAGSSSSG